MKKIHMLLVLSMVLASIGCTHNVTPIDVTSHENVKFIDDDDLGKVYISRNFNVNNYDVLLVKDVSIDKVFPIKDIEPEEMALILKHNLVEKIRETNAFEKVTDDIDILSENTEQFRSERILILKSEFTELDPGNRALRYFAYFTGAGRVKVQVETRYVDFQGDKMCQSSDRRVAVFGILGGNSKDFVEDSLEGIAEAHASFLKRQSKRKVD